VSLSSLSKEAPCKAVTPSSANISCLPDTLLQGALRQVRAVALRLSARRPDCRRYLMGSRRRSDLRSMFPKTRNPLPQGMVWSMVVQSGRFHHHGDPKVIGRKTSPVSAPCSIADMRRKFWGHTRAPRHRAAASRRRAIVQRQAPPSRLSARAPQGQQRTRAPIDRVLFRPRHFRDGFQGALMLRPGAAAFVIDP